MENKTPKKKDKDYLNKKIEEYFGDNTELCELTKNFFHSIQNQPLSKNKEVEIIQPFEKSTTPNENKK